MKITEEELIDKGIELFKKYGYQKVTVDQICASCHITKGSFYHHFKSKKDILSKFYVTIYKNPMDLVTEIAKCEKYRDKLWAVLEYGINFTIELGHEILFEMMTLNILPKYTTTYAGAENQEIEDDTSNLVMMLIKKAKENGELHNPNTPEDLWFNYQSALYGIALHWSANQAPYDEKKELRKLFDIIFF